VSHTSEPAAKKSPKAGLATGMAASRLIDRRIREVGGWRGETLARMRKLILETDPAIAEEVKWNVPVWTRDGIICTGEVYQKVVKLTFARGARLPDPSRLFNSSLEGNTRRAIDIREGEKIDARAFKALVRAAVALNAAGAARGSRSSKGAREPADPPRRRAPGQGTPASATTSTPLKSVAAAGRATKGVTPAATPADGKAGVRLLSGGNPQIAKGDGDAPVQAYIRAMPGWKRELGKRLDALIERAVPGVRKAVKWNSPFYGMEGRGWFLSFHVFTRYVKVTFFAGASLRPEPPGKGKDKDARWIDVYEGQFEEAQMERWVRQAAALPGWDPARKA